MEVELHGVKRYPKMENKCKNYSNILFLEQGKYRVSPVLLNLQKEGGVISCLDRYSDTALPYQ